MSAGPCRCACRFLLVALAALFGAHAAESQKLVLVDAALHMYDGGPGVAADWEFVPGDTVFLSFRIAGFRTEEKDEAEYLRLGYEIEAFDPDGIRVVESVGDAIAAEMTFQDRKNEWLPVVRHKMPVPPAAPSGTYRIMVRLRDEVSGATAIEEIPITIRGRDVAPSDTLVAPNFGFYRSQTSLVSLSVPSYRPGDTVWARFDITGYQFVDNNRFHINYGLDVLRASGELLFHQEVAADEQRESFYPERYIPGSFGLPLTDDLAAGDYTIILTVRDLLGEQLHETKQVFHVE